MRESDCDFEEDEGRGFEFFSVFDFFLSCGERKRERHKETPIFSFLFYVISSLLRERDDERDSRAHATNCRHPKRRRKKKKKQRDEREKRRERE